MISFVDLFFVDELFDEECLFDEFIVNEQCIEFCDWMFDVYC